MTLTLDDMNRIAHLARLEFQPEEQTQMLAQLNNFFNIVEQMRSVDTKDVIPLAHPISVIEDIALRLNPDEVTEKNQRELNQQNAPAVENGLFLVPKVIE